MEVLAAKTSRMDRPGYKDVHIYIYIHNIFISLINVYTCIYTFDPSGTKLRLALLTNEL